MLRLVDLNMVLAREESSGEKVLLKLDSLDAAPGRASGAARATSLDLEEVSSEDWEIARARLEVLEPLLQRDGRKRAKADYVAAGKAASVGQATVYRWMQAYLSLDSPSAMSAGLCIAHAILPKENWLARMGCTDVLCEWPFYGPMDVLHMDNAKEFRGHMLSLAAEEYHIDLHRRPVKVPHYGAHIERLMGTVSEDLKSVGGATFSGPREKGEYDAEGNACMTFDELEKWLVLFFARYHRDMHTGIGTTPLAKWREGILGTKTKPARGLPLRYTDTEKVRIDFMPFEERTIQDYGVVIDNVHYFHDVLRPWINAMDPDQPKLKRMFRFRYDPRDISSLYFFEPNAKRYFAIPYRDSSLPPVSIWELRAATQKATTEGMKHFDERTVFSLITRQREIEEQAAAKTKSARRAHQRHTVHEKARGQTKKDLATTLSPAPTSAPDAIRGYDPDKIKPLDDEY